MTSTIQARPDVPLPPCPTDLLTLTEARAACRVSRTTLWRWTAQEGLKTVSVRGIRRVRRCDLDKFFDRHTKLLADTKKPALQ